jgi:uncharacterized membrane protein YgcG
MHRSRISIACALSALATVLSATTTVAQNVAEEILAYDVLVDVRPGGQLAVSERITVRALGQQIRRGIYRDFPTSFPRWSGLGRIEAPFEVVQVLRDGEPEPYAVLSIGGEVMRGGVRIRAGESDVFLDPGVYEYTFEYLTDRWVRFADDRDELFWNVTGNEWAFPIRSASARVRIEELDVEPTVEAWTGPTGSTASDVAFSWDATSHEVSFNTTAGLGPEEGLTVRVSFPAGQLTRPSTDQQAEWFALDWGGYIEAGYLVLFVIGLYLLMWRRVGIDPAAGPVVPRSEPPPGFSPAALAYLEERGYETSQFAAVLVSMAMKGAIRIERNADTWWLHKENEQAPLAPEERRVFEELLGSSKSMRLAQTHHAKLRGAIKALKRSLARQLEREYFVNNRLWFVAGLVVSLVGLALLAWRWRFGIEPTAFFLGLWLTIWSAGVFTMVYRIAHLLRQGRHQPVAYAGAFALGLFSLPFIGAEIFVAGWLTTLVPTHLVAAVLLVGGTNVAFYHLLERPTLRGRGVLDHLEGFKKYLEGTRPNRLEYDEGIQRFEEYLPHAIALGIEERWAGGFGDALTPRQESDRSYVPRWYDGYDVGRGAVFNPTSFATSLGSSLSSHISSASSPPPSSGGGGGGGGGGSSGGGGGGGGGGGW